MFWFRNTGKQEIEIQEKRAEDSLQLWRRFCPQTQSWPLFARCSPAGTDGRLLCETGKQSLCAVSSSRDASHTVAMSIDAVASSMMRMLLFRTNARAKQKSCRWPTLKFSPPSVTTASGHKHVVLVAAGFLEHGQRGKIQAPSPPGRAFTMFFNWAISSASHSRSSVHVFSGSRLNLQHDNTAQL